MNWWTLVLGRYEIIASQTTCSTKNDITSHCEVLSYIIYSLGIFDIHFSPQGTISARKEQTKEKSLSPQTANQQLLPHLCVHLKARLKDLLFLLSFINDSLPAHMSVHIQNAGLVTVTGWFKNISACHSSGGLFIFHWKQGTFIWRWTLIIFCQCGLSASVGLVLPGEMSDVPLICSFVKCCCSFWVISAHTLQAVHFPTDQYSSQVRGDAVLYFFIMQSLRAHRPHWSTGLHLWSKEAIWKIIR